MLRRVKIIGLLSSAARLRRDKRGTVTVLFTVAVLVIFGGGAIFDFALVMLLGVIAGTYSTVYIATPVMLFFRKEQRSTNASKPTAS